MGSVLALAFTVAVVAAFLYFMFWMTRGFWLWYWRVNEIVNTLKSIDQGVRNIEEYEARRAKQERPPTENPGIPR